MEYPVVEIIWRDAECDPDWKEIDVISKGELPIVFTTGYLIHEDKKKYIVASTVGGNEATATIMIPVDWVTKISVITF